jgi:hypothetical protein
MFVILLGGSTKKRQSVAIGAAADAWTDYKRRASASATRRNSKYSR